MSLSPFEYLRHILQEIAYLTQQSEGLTQSAFMKDESLKRAFVRSIEIIGEATKNIPSEFRQQYPHIEWKAIAGMSDKLIHGYLDVDYDIVWNVVTSKLSRLRQDIETILQLENDKER